MLSECPPKPGKGQDILSEYPLLNHVRVCTYSANTNAKPGSRLATGDGKSNALVTLALGKEGIWFFIFPEREKTRNLQEEE